MYNFSFRIQYFTFKKMKLFHLLCPFFFLSLVHGTAKPNMIVIMCDDLGYADVGFNGCKDISTPNIDSIAEYGSYPR